MVHATQLQVSDSKSLSTTQFTVLLNSPPLACSQKCLHIYHFQIQNTDILKKMLPSSDLLPEGSEFPLPICSSTLNPCPPLPLPVKSFTPPQIQVLHNPKTPGSQWCAEHTQPNPTPGRHLLLETSPIKLPREPGGGVGLGKIGGVHNPQWIFTTIF